MSIGEPGTRTMTGPGALGTSDSSGRVFPVRVYYVSLYASGGTAGILSLHNGTSTASTTLAYLTALALSSDTWDNGYGLLCTSGCYVHMTTGTMHVAIQYDTEPA